MLFTCIILKAIKSENAFISHNSQLNVEDIGFCSQTNLGQTLVVILFKELAVWHAV